MTKLRKKVYVAAGYTTTFYGSGRKEFDPSKPMPKMESYLQETAHGTSKQIPNPNFDEGSVKQCSVYEHLSRQRAEEFDFTASYGLDTVQVARRRRRSRSLDSTVAGQYSPSCRSLHTLELAAPHQQLVPRISSITTIWPTTDEPLLPLPHSTTQPIYRRQGFEQAGTWTVYRLPTQAIDVRDRSMEVERVAPQDLDWAAIKDLYDRVAVGSAGLLDRNDWFWRRRFWIGTKELPAYVYTVSNEHGLQGYVSFTHRAGDRRFDLVVHDLIAATSAASRRLWSLLADHRSMAEHVEWAGPPSESLLLGLAEMEAEVVRRMHWMLRLVDVPAALESRGYLPGITGELHFAVSDGIIAANHGNWTMRVGNGVAKVSPGGRGEVALDVRGLAALYTGFMSPFQLRRAGLIEGNDHQLAVAAALFAGPAPWMVDFF